METVKVYMVRKPSDFEEVKTLCKKYTHEAEEVLIEETVNLINRLAHKLEQMAARYKAIEKELEYVKSQMS